MPREGAIIFRDLVGRTSAPNIQKAHQLAGLRFAAALIHRDLERPFSRRKSNASPPRDGTCATDPVRPLFTDAVRESVDDFADDLHVTFADLIARKQVIIVQRRARLEPRRRAKAFPAGEGGKQAIDEMVRNRGLN